MKKVTLKRFQVLLGVVFLISTIILWFSYQDYLDSLDSLHGPKETSVLAAIISSLISVTTLIGFVSTTLLAWRKDKREEKHSELDLRKKELEIEKLEKELE